MLLELKPKSWFSWDFDVSEDGSVVAHLDMSAWRERGEVIMHDVTYKLFRDGMTGPFLLESNGDVFATATKESVLRSSFAVEVVDHVYGLKKKSPFSRTFVLSEHGVEVGSMKATGAFSRRGLANFPDTLPLAVRVFLVWLVLIMWKREQDS